jgi:hypothetical protein
VNITIDDDWVMQVIREAQEEERRNPMTPGELVAEFKELAQYGAQQAKRLESMSKTRK